VLTTHIEDHPRLVKFFVEALFHLLIVVFLAHLVIVGSKIEPRSAEYANTSYLDMLQLKEGRIFTTAQSARKNVTLETEQTDMAEPHIRRAG
jgi:hypothetical protein